MTEQDLTKISNQIKEQLMAALAGDGLIDPDKAREVVEYYAIIIAKKDWLGKIFDKIRGTSDEGLAIQVVRACKYMNLEIPAPKSKTALKEKNDETD